jgi:hypothetical protein
MGANKAGDRSAAGAGQWKVELRVRPVMRDVWDQLLDFIIATWLGVLDRFLAPRLETAVDRAIRDEGERLRTAFPQLDERRRYSAAHLGITGSSNRRRRAEALPAHAPCPGHDRKAHSPRRYGRRRRHRKKSDPLG